MSYPCSEKSLLSISGFSRLVATLIQQLRRISISVNNSLNIIKAIDSLYMALNISSTAFTADPR